MARFYNPCEIGDTGPAGGFGDYGSFYSLVDQHHAVNTSHPMEFEITDLSHGISITNNINSLPTRITFDNQGIYNIAFSAQMHNHGGGGAGTTADIWLKSNDNDVASTNTRLTVNTNSPYIVAAWNFFVNVETVSQYFEIFWRSTNANIWIEHITGNGNVPDVPSIILTVNQVG